MYTCLIVSHVAPCDR